MSVKFLGKGVTYMERIAIFIDGAYGQYMLKEEFSSPKIDFGIVRQTITNRPLATSYLTGDACRVTVTEA